MDTNIKRLIETISNSIKNKDEEITSLKTDLEICENRIKKLEKINKDLQKINIKYSRQLRENIIYKIEKKILKKRIKLQKNLQSQMTNV